MHELLKYILRTEAEQFTKMFRIGKQEDSKSRPLLVAFETPDKESKIYEASQQAKKCRINI